LLEGGVLPPVPEVEVADRRMGIGLVQDDVGGDPVVCRGDRASAGWPSIVSAGSMASVGCRGCGPSAA
jgi:hypothetical protein